LSFLTIHLLMSSPRLEKLQAFLSASPDDPFLLFAVAKEYESLKDTQEALAYYLAIRAKQPAYVGLYYHLGKLYEQLSQPQQAWEAYTAGMEVAKLARDQHALGELAGARLNLGDEEDFT